MLPKSQYLALSPEARAAFKASLGTAKRRSAPKKRIAVKRYSGRRQVLRGRGDYWTGPGSKRSSSMFDSAGARAGGAVFGAPGKVIGGALHGLFKKLTGYGDYSVKSNTFMTGNTPPLFASKGRGMVIQHREFLGDVVTSSGAGQFNLVQYPINAAQPSTFPWLSQIAGQFEQYSVRGMIFEFKSMSSDALNSTNTALGSVIMATQYNSVNPSFTNKSQMENHEFSSSCKSSVDFVHGIECARGETPVSALYTRSGPVPVGSDPRLYDLGQFQIATVGFQGTSVNIGELWCTYDIELLKPQLVSPAFNSPVPDHWSIPGPTSAAPFGAAGAATLKSGGTGTILTVNATYPAGIVTFPLSVTAEQYLVTYFVNGVSTLLTVQLTPTLSAGAVGYNYFNNNTGQLIRQPAGTTNNVQFCMQSLTVLANAGNVNLGFLGTATMPASATWADLTITQLPSPSLFNPKLSLSDSKSEDKEEYYEENFDHDYSEFLQYKERVKEEKKKFDEQKVPHYTEDEDFVKFVELKNGIKMPHFELVQPPTPVVKKESRK